MSIERSIEVLNKLVEINNDRIEGYERASKEAKDADLKKLFFQLAQTSRRCNIDLRYEIYRIDGQPTDGTRITGKFFRAWMDFKAALSGSDRRIILDSCEFGENVAIEGYESVLNNDRSELTADQNAMLYEQYTMIKDDRDRIRTLLRNVEPK